VVITRLTAGGPLARVGAKVGDRLAGRRRRPRQPHRCRPPRSAGSTPPPPRPPPARRTAGGRLRQGLERQAAGAAPGSAGRRQRVVTLDDRIRPLSALGPEFWANLAFGLIATLIVGWVWALRPRELSTQLFALTGLSMLAFTFGWAVNSSVELVMASGLDGDRRDG
jgi:hypothetical protein